MGIYLNPSNKGFWEAIRSKIYVDKTNLIICINERINTEEKYICVSRPRRFGKSMTLKMLAAYYSRGCDSRSLFAGFKIEHNPSFMEYLNQYDVIYLNMQQFLSRAKTQSVTDYLEQAVISEMRKVYGELFSEQETNLVTVLEQIYTEADTQFIFLIDEWDCVMREKKEAKELQKQYLDFLRDLLKDQPYVALAYMTGILPVKKYGSHSALNMFWEYSMTDQNIFEEYTGFTDKEVSALCERFHMNFVEMGSWYDGYLFTDFQHIYNPKSVVEAMHRHKFSNYWTATETYEALKIYMDMDFDGLRADIVKMLGGGHIKINTLSFQNDMCSFETKDDVLTLLIHLGYLAYDSLNQETFIPNKEIMREFETAMGVSGWTEVMRVLRASEQLLEDTLHCDAQSVAEALDRAHMEVASILTYNDENSLACAMGLAYYSARNYYKIIRELPAGRGFADIVFLPLPLGETSAQSSADPCAVSVTRQCVAPSTIKPALIVELKYNQSAQTAIQQIKDRQYIQALEGYCGEVLLVGINYDKNNRNKPHSCIIEKIIIE